MASGLAQATRKPRYRAELSEESRVRHRYVDLIVNRARSYIFTTASSPADAAAGLAAIGVLRSPEGAALRDRLRTNVEALRPSHPSPIVPVLCGEEQIGRAHV